VSGRTVADSAREQGAAHVEFAPAPAAAAEAAVREARAGDTVITLGAGDVWKLADDVLARLAGPAVAGGRPA
jgi:UDP-N-acetylmuramate-alanine ligase